jgi:hypothetical protein
MADVKQEPRVAMRDQSNVIIIQANEKSKEVTMKIKNGSQD